MLREIRVVLVEDNAIDAEMIDVVLGGELFKPILSRVQSKVDFLAALNVKDIDVIISDFSLPGYSGKEALVDAQKNRPEVPFIFYSGTIGEEAAIEALKLGAIDYVLKDKPKRLTAAVDRALKEADQKKRQHAADEQIRAQAQLLDMTRDAIVVRDLDDKIEFINSGAENLYGYKREEVVGHRSTEFMTAKLQKVYDEVKQTTLREGHWEGEMEHYSKAKKPILVMSRWTLVRNPSTQKEEILAVYTDITEKKELERQFLRAQRLESIGTLASGIAHDLNNILAPIMMAGEILQEEDLRPEAQEMVTTIQRSAERGAEIVKQVLTFVRGNEGKRIPIVLGYLVKDIAKVASETFPKNIKVNSSVDNDLWAVMGDPTHFHQVLMNLCVNARDAMPNGGRLTLSAKNVADNGQCRVMLQVEDTGSGIPKEIVDKIFDPFFTTKDIGQGTGLGLSTVLGIVKSHGGTISVESNTGAGTRFNILLPADRISPRMDEKGRQAPIPRGLGELILVVDDEAEIRKTTSQILSQHGYEVISAEDGSSAIIEFTQHKRDIKLLITDLMMPGMDGNALMKVISILNPEVPVIITSGLPDRTAHQSVARVLRKPLSGQELLRAVHEVLHSVKIIS